MYKITMLFGVFLIFAPSLFGYENFTIAYVLNVMSGIVIMTLSLLEKVSNDEEKWEYRLEEVIGVGSILTPVLFRFAWQTPAFWVSIAIGLLLLLVDIRALEIVNTKKGIETE